MDTICRSAFRGMSRSEKIAAITAGFNELFFYRRIDNPDLTPDELFAELMSNGNGEGNARHDTTD